MRYIYFIDYSYKISLQIIGMSHIFSNTHPEKARVMVWVLAGLSTLAG